MMNAKIFVIGLEPSSSFFNFHRNDKCCHGNDHHSRFEELEKEVDMLKARVNDLELEAEKEDFDEPYEEPSFEPAQEPDKGDMRFGAEFAVDEPIASNYNDKDEFLYDRRLFDEFVEVGEECIERGLGRPDWAEPRRCNAIRKKVGECPPFGIDLIGETEWWEEDPDWDEDDYDEDCHW